MVGNGKRSAGVGLERSCAEGSADWIRSTEVIAGVELLEAWFHGRAYRKHRHDTYAISLTETGVQAFDYRGSSHASTPGHVVVLHPDEAHDGRAGSEAGFAYRQVYVEPALVYEAVRALRGPGISLPFVPRPVVTSLKLKAAVLAAFRDERDPLAIDDLVVRLAEGLLEADPSHGRALLPRRVDEAAIERARQFLDAESTRVVRSSELEAVTGLSRYDLARQFRAVMGTSPYRYLLMRRLDRARQHLTEHRSLVEVALDTGFADQAHFTRVFSGAFGITPAIYRKLRMRSQLH